MTQLVTAGWPVLTAYHAALAARRGTTVIVDGPQDELDLVMVVLSSTCKVVVDSFMDIDFVERLLVEAA
jgi:hypothetical protein